MGDQEFDPIQFYISRLDKNGSISSVQAALQEAELYANDFFVAVKEINAKGGIMKGDRESRFDEIIDVINDARIKGLLPIEISTHDDDQSRPFWYEFMDTGERIILPPRDFIVTIRFRRQ